MKCVINPRALADAVAWTGHAVPQRPSMPILAGMVLEADSGGDLILSAFDYELSTRASIEATGVVPGRALVPGRLLADVVKSLAAMSAKGRDVELALDGQLLNIICGTTRFEIAVMPLDDYPKLPETPPVVAEVNADQLRHAVAQTVVAAARDTTLPALTGIHLTATSDGAVLGATDRYKMVARRLAWKLVGDLPKPALIPGRALHDLVKALPPGDVQIGVSESMVSVEGGGRRSTIRLIGEAFPDISKQMARVADNPIIAEFDVAEFLAAFKRVALMASHNTPVTLEFRVGEVTLRAGQADSGRSSETIPADLAAGGPIMLAFAPAHLGDPLAVAGTERARLAMSMPTTPALLTGVGGGAPDWRCMTMPIRLQG